MSRLPIRLRLTLAFTIAMAFVLAAVGTLLYVRLGDALAEQVDDALETRAATLAPVVRARGEELTTDELGVVDDEGLAQVLEPGGAVLASSPRAQREPLLRGRALAEARARPTFTRSQEVAALDGHDVRLLARPVTRDSGTLVLVVGASLEDRAEALRGLLAQLALVGPLALLGAALGGYLLAGAALGPVDAMRHQATLVTSERPERRLTLPAAHDEVRRLGETLNEMLDRLEAGLTRERQFVADASHELRTPLSLLLAELELALRRPRSHAELEAALRSAADEAERLSRLADDLLVLAQADEGGLGLSREPVPVTELVATVIRRFTPRAETAGRAIESCVVGNPVVYGDRLRLEQMLGNLVDNALRHGSGAITIDAVAQDDDGLELGVADEGTGFSPELLPRAFDRFTRADESRSHRGAGLGLAIVAAIVRAHDGTVRASGATVTVALPQPGANPVARGDTRSGLVARPGTGSSAL